MRPPPRAAATRATARDGGRPRAAPLSPAHAGSGKTFSITGGAERYADRGIIPRALSRVFAEVKADPKVQFVIRVSYMEIYNEVAYDLLDQAQETKALEDLPCVLARVRAPACSAPRRAVAHRPVPHPHPPLPPPGA